MGSSKCEAQGACCALPSLLLSSPWVPGAALCGCPAQGLGRCCRHPFPSCCWRQEQFFLSPQHNKWFRWFSASLAVVWDQTPTRLGVVHILKEQSMPLATYIFFLWKWMAAADKQGEQKVTMRVKAADGGDEELVHTHKGLAGFAAGEDCLEQQTIKLPWAEGRWAVNQVLWKYRVVTKGARTSQRR